MAVQWHQDREFGAIRLQSDKRIRRLSLKVSHASIVLNVPRWSSKKNALAWLDENRSWVRNQLRKTEVPNPYEPGKKIALATGRFIEFDISSDRYFHIVSDEAGSRILIPGEIPINQRTHGTEFCFRKALKAEAEPCLRSEMQEISEKMNLSFNTLRVKTLRSRWGSCSVKKNINLNSKLILLNFELRHYVYLHELAHLKHRNHGPGFWKLLNTWLDGNARQLDRELSKVKLPF